MNFPIDTDKTDRQLAVEFFYLAARESSVAAAKNSANPMEVVVFLGQVASDAFKALGITPEELDEAKNNHPA